MSLTIRLTIINEKFKKLTSF